jgi:hypothetical protein
MMDLVLLTPMGKIGAYANFEKTALWDRYYGFRTFFAKIFVGKNFAGFFVKIPLVFAKFGS